MRISVICLFLSAIVLLPCDTVFAASTVFEVEHELYPNYPSLIKWNKSNAGFTEPAVCTGCHPQQYEEWTGSVHAPTLKSAADLEIFPIYRNRRLTDVKVRVKNIRAGHNLPTSLTNVRQM